MASRKRGDRRADLSASEGWQDAVARLGGAFADGAPGLSAVRRIPEINQRVSECLQARALSSNASVND